MKNFIKNIFLNQKFKFMFIIFLGFLTAMGELISIGAITPVVIIINDIGKLETIPGYSILNSNFDSPEHAIYIILISAIIISMVLRIILIRHSTFLAQNIGFGISKDVFQNILDKDYSDFKKMNSDDYLSLINVKVNIFVNRVILPFINILTSSLMLILIIFGLLFLNAKIVIFLIATSLLIYLLFNTFNKSTINKLSIINSENNVKVINIIKNLIGAFKEIKVANNSDAYIKSFEQYEKPFRQAQAKIQIITMIPRYMFEAFFLIVIILIAVFMSDELQIEELAGFAFAIQRILPLAQMINASYLNAKSSVHVMEDIIYFSRTSSEEVPDNNIDVIESISLINCDIGYTEPILSDFCLDIKKNEKILIYGESGVGKSTLVDTIIGLLKPLKGDVLVNHKNQSLINKVALVPQEVYIFDSSIKENIIMNKDYDHDLFQNVIKTTKLDEVIKKYGESYYVGDNGKKLSGGQRQRISLARALYQRRDVLILDEFTSALDYDTSNNLLDMISKIKNMIIILISHDVLAKEYFENQIELK